MGRFEIRVASLLLVCALIAVGCGGDGDSNDGRNSTAGSGGGGAQGGSGSSGATSSGGTAGEGSGGAGGAEFGPFSCGSSQCDGAEEICRRVLPGIPDGSEQSSCEPYPEGCTSRDCSCYAGPACTCVGEAGSIQLVCAAP